jgi:deoxyxylulose-5-phosphate synthase
MEGSMGPVAGSSHHSIYHRMPGVKIVCPMTPDEYKFAYNSYLCDDDVYYISEHRRSFDNASELPDTLHWDKPDIVLFPISCTRFEAEKARIELEATHDMKISIAHQCWLKPYRFSQESLNALSNSKHGGIVLDDDYIEGTASHLAYELMLKTGKKILSIGLESKTAGFAAHHDNLPPDKDRIISTIKSICKI